MLLEDFRMSFLVYCLTLLNFFRVSPCGFGPLLGGGPEETPPLNELLFL